MKITKRTVLLSIILLSSALTSCYEEYNSSVTGQATATPSTASNGDTITLSIGGFISSSGEATIGHKKYYPIIHYLIDGKEVATSREKSCPFNATYIVKDLSDGEHIITVEVSGSRKNANFENKVGYSTLNVK